MPSNPKRKRRYPFKRIMKRKMRRIIFMLVAAAIATGVNYYNKYDSDGKGSSTNITSVEFSVNEQQLAVKKIKSAKDDTMLSFGLVSMAK